MTVVAFVGGTADAKPVVTWAGIFMQQIREGKNTPFALALTNEARDALIDHVKKKPGVEIVFAGRAGIERESDPVDVGIVLSSKRPLARSEADELIELLRTSMRNPGLRVKITCVAAGWADEPVDEAPPDAALVGAE